MKGSSNRRGGGRRRKVKDKDGGTTDSRMKNGRAKDYAIRHLATTSGGTIIGGRRVTIVGTTGRPYHKTNTRATSQTAIRRSGATLTGWTRFFR